MIEGSFKIQEETDIQIMIVEKCKEILKESRGNEDEHEASSATA